MENEILHAHIRDYLAKMHQTDEPLLQEMEQSAKKQRIPIIQPESGRLLQMFCMLKNPKRILEVGTAIGYSSIMLAKTSGNEACVDTIEIDEEMVKRAQFYIRRAGLEKTIRVLQGDATEVLQCLSTPYDLIFLDAAKGQYLEFYPHCLRLLKPGGLLLSDNILYRGMVAKPGQIEHKHRTIITRLREYLNILCKTPELTTSIIPVGDGMAATFKNTPPQEYNIQHLRGDSNAD